MTENISFALLCFTSFLTLVNPLGLVPVFMTMTAKLDPKAKRKTAEKAVLAAFIAMLFFAFSGQLLFSFFGISVNGFRMVGGVIFFLAGYDMLQARLVSTKVSKSDVHRYVSDISITPLAVPMICGPGSITNAIVLTEDAADWGQKLLVVGAMACVLLITLVLLRSSDLILRLLGETGNNIMMRMMGLIMMVIAVEFFFSGLKPVLVEIIRLGNQ